MIIKEIINRRSVRDYKPDEVNEEDIVEIIKAGQFAPTAKHNQTVEFIIVKNQETKEKIFGIVGQEYVKEAPVLIIPVIDTTKSVLPIQDLSVASENMFLQATALDLGSVWKNLDPAWQEKIKKLLGLPENFMAINIIPVGHPRNKTKPHDEKDFSAKKIHREKW
jgi:nitroreductase